MSIFQFLDSAISNIMRIELGLNTGLNVWV